LISIRSNNRKDIVDDEIIVKMQSLLRTILEFILILEKIIMIYNKAEKKNEATAVS
jgi:hypothetical protein